LNTYGLIPESTLSEIQLKVDIVELISQYVPLKGAGRNYKALCPFHSEKSPSFMVNPEKQIFHCFGCGAGGNVFGFVMRYENINFPEAVEILAAKAGVIIPKSTGGVQETQKKSLFEVMEKVTQYFEKTFMKHDQARGAREYLRSRGLNRKAVEIFRIGYCLQTETEVFKEFDQLGIEKKLLEKVGLLTQTGSQEHLRFKGRIIFPISDVQGRIVGFGGRALGDRLPKYLNSPDTVLFNKSNLLYGLNLAKRSILQKSQAVLVEGYLDVISVFCSGIENVIASLGTAFNESHVRQLRRYTQEVIVAYDGDSAGIEASLRALEVFLDQDIIVKIAKMPAGHDPDSWVRKAGKETFEKLIDQAPSMIDFKLDILSERYQGQKEKGKLLISREILPILKRLKNPVLQDHYVQVLAQRLGTAENTIRQELRKDKKSQLAGTQKTQLKEPSTRSHVLEEDILLILLSENRLFEIAREKIQPDDFESNDCKFLYEKVLENKIDLIRQDPQYQGILARLLMMEHPFKDAKLELIKFITELKIRSYARKREKLFEKLKENEKNRKDNEKRNVILSEILKIDKEIAFLKKK
jgi:DNA primase